MKQQLPPPKKKTNTILKDVSPIENGGFSIGCVSLPEDVNPGTSSRKLTFGMF